MKNYNILVIDDDKPFHILAKKILEQEYTSFHAYNAQEGINILSKENINLVLCDLYMPGLDGLEFLESLKNDKNKKRIPVLVVTNLPTQEKREQALNFGAVDIVEKSDLISDREKLLNLIELKLVTDIDLPEIGNSSDINTKKNKLVSELIKTAVQNDFDTTAAKLCNQIKKQFGLDYMSLWILNGGEAKLNYSVGDVMPEDGDTIQITGKAVEKLKNSRESYLSNNILSGEKGVLRDFSKKHNLNAEIGVPLFSLEERNLLMNDMEVTKQAPIFGFVSLKRNKLFTTEEYKMISRLLIQTGSILWRLLGKSHN